MFTCVHILQKIHICLCIHIFGDIYWYLFIGDLFKVVLVAMICDENKIRGCCLCNIITLTAVFFPSQAFITRDMRELMGLIFSKQILGLTLECIFTCFEVVFYILLKTWEHQSFIIYVEKCKPSIAAVLGLVFN